MCICTFAFMPFSFVWLDYSSLNMWPPFEVIFGKENLLQLCTFLQDKNDSLITERGGALGLSAISRAPNCILPKHCKIMLKYYLPVWHPLSISGLW